MAPTSNKQGRGHREGGQPRGGDVDSKLGIKRVNFLHYQIKKTKPKSYNLSTQGLGGSHANGVRGERWQNPIREGVWSKATRTEGDELSHRASLWKPRHSREGKKKEHRAEAKKWKTGKDAKVPSDDSLFSHATLSEKNDLIRKKKNQGPILGQTPSVLGRAYLGDYRRAQAEYGSGLIRGWVRHNSAYQISGNNRGVRGEKNFSRRRRGDGLFCLHT